ncbi:MAG: FtsX-like permease family protein [Candidatus Hydrogenedentes bacterium]|nr:FtsX-like permease family protein [Candidatus Hydrogenedentota bacterium]
MLSQDAKKRAGIKRQIRLPNSEAFKIALRSIKIRFWRSIVTMAGIILAIAFLSYVMTAGWVERGVQAADETAVRDGVQARATQFWLIGISLLVCVVGITNAMLMSVTERYREIGTMKCLGALDWFVVKLFLIEAMLQGVVGSLAGACIGFTAAVLAGMTQYDGVLGSLPWGAALLSLTASVAVGGVLSVLGAVYPARRAGKMPPADAMRTEI